MALVVKDRVRQTSTTAGTGTITLTGSVSGFQAFSVIGDGNTTYYTIVDPTTGDWEVGVGTYTLTGTTLSRDTVLESSNAGNLVSFGSAVKDVFCTYPAERSVYTNAAGTAITPATASTLGVASGGTGLSSYTANGIVYASGTTTLASSSGLTFNGTNFATTGSVTSAGASNSGNLTFTGTGNRITGDFSNGTAANRVAFQTSTTNGNTTVGVLPNGTGNATTLVTFNGSDPANANPMQLRVTASEAGLFLGANGTASGIPMTFWNGGSERVRIDTSGNVGIGTSSPFSAAGFGALTINGTSGGVTSYYVNGTETGRVQAISGAFSLSSVGASTVTQFNTGGSERMRIDSSGNVGIGTSSPSYMLDITGQGRATTGWAVSTDGSTFTPSGLNAIPNYGVGYITSTSQTALSGFGGIPFYTNQVERMRIDSSGNVGIGQSYGLTNSRLVVSGQSAGGDGAYATGPGSIVLNETGRSSVNDTGGLEFKTSVFGSGYGAKIIALDAGSLVFGNRDNSATYTERLRIDSSGKVGIGTSSPSQNVTVSNSSAVAVDLGIVNTQSSTTSFIASTSTTYAFAGVGASTSWYGGDKTVALGNYSAYPIQFVTDGSERARIDTSGNLIIGASAISSYFDGLLNVAGRIHTKTAGGTDAIHYLWNTSTTGNNGFIEFGTDATYAKRGSITYNRAGGLVAYNTTSDYRAKDIIGPVQNSGEVIDALKVYEGVMKGATQSRPMLVAHEAQEVAPYAVTGEKDAVNKDGTPKFQQMDMSSLVPLLLAEIQSLRKRLAALEAA